MNKNKLTEKEEEQVVGTEDIDNTFDWVDCARCGEQGVNREDLENEDTFDGVLLTKMEDCDSQFEGKLLCPECLAHCEGVLLRRNSVG